MKAFNELKNRGLDDILIAVTDGLNGMAEAVGAVFPRPRHAANLHRAPDARLSGLFRTMLAAIRPIYAVPERRARRSRVGRIRTRPVGRQFSTGVAAWGRGWERPARLFVFPLAVRLVIGTTDAIESTNAMLRAIIDNSTTAVSIQARRTRTLRYFRRVQPPALPVNYERNFAQ